MTVDDAHETFINTLTEITDLHAPIKTIIVHPKKIIINPWMTPALLQSSETLSKLYRKILDKPLKYLISTKITGGKEIGYCAVPDPQRSQENNGEFINHIIVSSLLRIKQNFSEGYAD